VESRSRLPPRIADAPAFETGLVTLLRDRVLTARLGEKGLAAIAGRYSWKKDERRFIEAIQR